MLGNLQSKIACAAIIAFMLPLGIGHAQSVSSGQILDALKIKPKREMSATRSFGVKSKNDNQNEVSSSERSFIRSINATRAIRVEQREKLIEIVEKSDLPSINIRILFDYDSDRIKPGSFADLNEIGEALLDESLAESKIMLNGHTDAAGSRTYNQDLSERRALSVKRYLTGKLFVPTQRLVVAGFGEERLSDKDDPNNAKNRRVEIVNLGK